MDHELLVVDNNSSDSTRKVVERHASQHPAVRYLFEPRQGLSQARNAGVAAAKGDLVAFTDDDVYFDSGWLEQTVRAFAAHQDAACIGGRTMPVFESSEPKWLPTEFWSIYGTTGSGEECKQMRFPEHPFGVNMAFRKEVFRRIGMFNPALGRNRHSLLSNEEVELFRRVHEAGLKVVYEPSAVILHRIPADRATPEWVMHRYYWQGVSEVVLQRVATGFSRGAGLARAWQEGKAYITSMTGGHWSPRKIYWHYNRLPWKARIRECMRLGRIRQLLLSSIT
jgi:GT2 family glycosyltransferase